MKSANRSGATRREVLRRGARFALVIPAAAASSAWLAACAGEDERQRKPSEPTFPAKPAAPAPSPEPSPAPVAPPAEPAPAAPAANAGGSQSGNLVTDLASVAPMVAALQYTNTSAKADQRCSNCQLFTATEGGVGKCQLFPDGLVKEGGWCASWAAKAG